MWNIVLALEVITVYYVGVGIYRLFFHPLAGFPGPKLAALTLWYEFYYDVIGRGKYLWKVKELHEKYGNPQLLLASPNPRLKKVKNI